MNIKKNILIAFSFLMLLSGCTKQLDNSVSNDKQDLEQEMKEKYTKVNSDDIYDYLDDDCKKIFEEGAATFNSYSSLKNIGEDIVLLDAEGNELDFSGKTLLHIINNIDCPYLDGKTDSFYEQIINDYDYRIYQIFFSEEDKNKYYENVNLEQQNIDGLEVVIINKEDLSKYGFEGAEETVFVKNNKIVLDRKAGIGTIDTFDFADRILIKKINSCSTLKEALKKYEKEVLNKYPSEPEREIIFYKNEAFNNPLEVEKDKYYVIGLKIDREDLKPDENSTFLNGIRDMLGTLSDEEIFINRKPDGEILYEEENANVYLKIKVINYNTTGYFKEADAGISFLYMMSGNSYCEIKISPVISFKLVD